MFGKIPPEGPLSRRVLSIRFQLSLEKASVHSNPPTPPTSMTTNEHPYHVYNDTDSVMYLLLALTVSARRTYILDFIAF